MPMRVVMGIAALHPSYGLPIPARLPRKAEAILFLHSTFVREEHPGRRLTLSAIGLYAGRVVARAAAKLPHWIGELSPPLNKWRSIMLRMMLLGLLIPLGVGVLAAMELKTPARNAVVVVQSPAETTVGISDSHRALAKADRLEIAAASSEAPAQPALAHDPEKWVPVFRKDHAQIKEIERDDDSKKRHPALDCSGPQSAHTRVVPRAGGQSPLWVKSGLREAQLRCPLTPRQRTLLTPPAMSEKCQKRT